MPSVPCEEPKAVEWVEGIETKRCPVSYYPMFYQAIRGAAHYESHLPHSGGWADQPALLMELIEVFNG